MKTFFAVVFSFTTLLLTAAPAFHGSFLNALQEQNPELRMSMIIDALTQSEAPVCDENALKLLIDGSNNGFLKPSAYPGIYQLAKKKSTDFLLAEFAVALAAGSYPIDAELLNIIEKNILSADLSKLQGRQYFAALRVINLYHNHRLFGRALQKSYQLNTILLEKYPDDRQILKKVITSTIYGCFAANCTTPALPSFAELPATDIYKQRLNTIGQKLLQLPVSNTEEAELIIECANILAHPETVALLKKYAALYPAHRWTAVSAEVAGRLKNPALLVKSGEFFYDFIFFLSCGATSEAKKMLDSLPQNYPEKLRLELQFIYWNYAGEYSSIVNAVNSGKINLAKSSSSQLNTIINAVHFQRDKALAAKILTMINTKYEKENFSDPSACNAIGYICADLNIDLPTAEKLIRIAVKDFPYSAAFRDSLAWVLFKQGKINEAAQEIDIAIKNTLTPSGAAVIYLHAAEIKYAQKDFDIAKLYLALAMRLYDPDDIGCSEYDLKAEKRLQRVLK